MKIRHEQLYDKETIREVLEKAFDLPTEAKLVDKLRNSGKNRISLVAEIEGRVVGQILFTEVEIAPPHEKFHAVGLAPMSVAPEYQGKGIGSALIKRGIEECRKKNYSALFVLGHPNYYPRFGFILAKNKGLDNTYNADHAFFVLELFHGALDNVKGTVTFQPEFEETV